ncbi:MAG: aromatic amino acid hydroxylase [Chlorobi bacterium]|nr:aromatic amino acid hydroxylase [Chlorobiota bacterium]
MFENEIIDRLPKHLKSFIVDQNYSRYTPQNQAVWRYVMRQNIHYLGEVAHSSYLDGLKKTGISVDRIPDMEEMNRILKKIGWAAVTVDGFIPPAAFMEFQKHKVLVIAADIRPFDQVEYTPAPDIIHEAAGHAPIIADPEYASYLQRFGEIGSKAFSSKKDNDLYEIIRHLSILKADPATPAEEITEAEACLKRVSGDMGMPSEMALIRNLHWWTVEYGLIGDMKNPKIYGAGLLSSIGESKSALRDEVIKLPYNLDTMDYGFDITKPQPQLFVTPDFDHLNKVLDEFANRMAMRTGGIEGIMKAIESENTATVVYSSGLQVSGTVTDIIVNEGTIVYLRTTGPATLNYRDKMLEGHSKEYHKEGFGSPVGRIKGVLKPTRFLDDQDLKKLGIRAGEKSKLEFETGVVVEGVLQDITRKEGKLLIMSFHDCLVKFKDEILFRPEWGVYDMAVGEKIVSVFNGPADPDGFQLQYKPPEEKTHELKYDDKTLVLHKLYGKVREIREEEINGDELPAILDTLEKNYRDDWLLPVEILEIVRKNNIDGGFEKRILTHLEKIKNENSRLTDLIENGISLAGK